MAMLETSVHVTDCVTIVKEESEIFKYRPTIPLSEKKMRIEEKFKEEEENYTQGKQEDYTGPSTAPTKDDLIHNYERSYRPSFPPEIDEETAFEILSECVRDMNTTAVSIISKLDKTIEEVRQIKRKGAPSG